MIDDAYTVSLLHFDIFNAWTDDAGKIWTPRGNAQIVTTQSVFGGASVQLDGTGDYFDTPDHADWQLDGGSDSNTWTVDGRFRYNGDPGTGIAPIVQQFQDVDNFWAIYLQGNTLIMRIRSGGADIVNLNNAWNPATATWYHVAVVKNGTTGYLMFIDGTQIGTTQTDTSPMPDFNGVLQIGRFTAATGANTDMNGWIDEVRISKGIARWTANFTPPSWAYGITGWAMVNEQFGKN